MPFTRSRDSIAKAGSGTVQQFSKLAAFNTKFKQAFDGYQHDDQTIKVASVHPRRRPPQFGNVETGQSSLED
jgi:hypothetical protein